MPLKVAGAYWPGSARFATGPENPTLLIKVGLSVGHVPGMKKPHLFDFDPLGRSVHEHLVTADRKVAPATFVLWHVLISVAAGRIRIIAPSAFNSHYCVRG